MSAKSVLILGGNGKVSKLLTSLLLNKGWNVTSIIRAEEQVAAIQALGQATPHPQRLKVLVRSIEDVKSEADAKVVLDESAPDYVVWSAGAGGKGAPERTFAIDRDAAIHFINAQHSAAAAPAIKRFLMVSYLGSRRSKPSWWSDGDWDAMTEVNNGALARYYQAKLAADEVLYRASRDRPDFAGICLRPGTLTDEPAGGVDLGRTQKGVGKVSRASVAQTAAGLLGLDDGSGVGNCWLDLLDGDEEVGRAVERVAGEWERVDCAEGDAVFGEK